MNEREAGGRESNPHGPVLETGTQPIEHPPYGGGGEAKWAGRDLNPRSASAADLQSASFNRTWIPTQNKGKSGPGRTRTCDILFVGEASLPLNDGTNAGRKGERGGKWSRRDSNPQPPGCRPGALPIGATVPEISGAYGNRTRDRLVDNQPRYRFANAPKRGNRTQQPGSSETSCCVGCHKKRDWVGRI